MERLCREVASCGLGIAKHVKGDAIAQAVPGTHAVDRFLHLAVTAVAAFHGVGGRRQQLVVQEGESLLQVGAKEFLKGLAYLLETTDPAAELAQLPQGGLDVAVATHKTIDLVVQRRVKKLQRNMQR
jgi:hypothetical protein